MGLGIGIGETLDGHDKTLSGMLVPAPDLRDHGAAIIPGQVEEPDPVDVALANLQTFPIQAGTVLDV